MANSLTSTLETLVALTSQDRQAIEAALGPPVAVEAGRDILGERKPSDACAVLLKGMAYRFRWMSNGRKQLLAFLIAGDILALDDFLLSQRSDAFCALDDCTVTFLRRDAINGLLSDHPRVALGLWRATLLDGVTLREWLVQFGQGSARERMAHLFCEIAFRLRSRGLTAGDSFVFPVSQEILGAALGLSEVHVNRTLKFLREENLVSFRGRLATIHDWHGLRAAGRFDPPYLQTAGTLPNRPLAPLWIADGMTARAARNLS